MAAGQDHLLLLHARKAADAPLNITTRQTGSPTVTGFEVNGTHGSQSWSVYVNQGPDAATVDGPATAGVNARTGEEVRPNQELTVPAEGYLVVKG